MAGIFDKIGSMLGFSDEKKPDAYTAITEAMQPFLDSLKIKPSEYKEALTQMVEKRELTIGDKTYSLSQLSDKLNSKLDELPQLKESFAKLTGEAKINFDKLMPSKEEMDKLNDDIQSGKVKIEEQLKAAKQQAGSLVAKLQGNSDKTPKDHVTEQVAKQVKDFGSLLNLGIDPNDTAEHNRIAKELIENRQLTRKDGIVLKISTLDKMISDEPTYKATLEEQFGKGATLESVIPTAPKRDAINTAINNAEKENSGMFGVGFINAFMGLLSWVFGGFSGGMAGLTESVATTAASSMAKDTEKHLAASKVLSPEEIARVKETVHTTALERAGITVVKKDTGAATEQTAAATTNQPPQQETTETKDKKTETSLAAGAGASTGNVQKPDEKQSDKKTEKDDKNKETQGGKPPAEKKQTPPVQPTVVVESKPDNSPQKNTKTTNLEKSVNNLIDNFLSKNKDFALQPEQIAAIKVAVNNTLMKNKSEGALSNPDYTGNYQIISNKIAGAILKDAGLSKHELLKDTPYEKQEEIFAKKIQESLASGDGKKIREAHFTDKAQQSASMIDFKNLGITHADASALGIYKQNQASTGIA